MQTACPGDALIVVGKKPAPEISNEISLSDSMENEPSVPVIVPLGVPFTLMDAPGSGAPEESVTWPFIILTWARTETVLQKSTAISIAIFLINVFLIINQKPISCIVIHFIGFKDDSI